MVVVKTVSGHAQSVCESIDRIGWDEVVGTIAGENTIFVAAHSNEGAANILAHLSAICGD
jgi:transcriptional regulator of arginine metabolism